MPSVESGVGHLATSRLMTLSGFKVAQGLDMIKIEVRDPYRALLGTDLGEAMEDHTSVYIRVSFEVADPSRFDQLILRMQVDDGFVAYLNGERIASDRAPRRTSWDATADGASLDVDADRFDLFDITEHLSALRDGNNVLAIHGFNRSASVVTFGAS